MKIKMNVITDFVSKNKIKRNILSQYRQGKRDFKNINIKGADLIDASLNGANLSGAFLNRVFLCNADLNGANLSGAFLFGANLRGADLEGADLRGADLRGAFLRGADLEGADLRGAFLRGALLLGADLRGAGLQGADLQGANLLGADLEGANLEPIWQDLREVVVPNISEIQHLYNALKTGKIDGSTYEGECSCLSGTLAYGISKKQAPKSVLDKRDKDRPAERFFLRIKPGNTIDNSWDCQQVAHQLQLIADEHSIKLQK